MYHPLYQPNLQRSSIRNFQHQLSFSQNCPRKRLCVSFEYQGYCETRPHRSYCFLSMLKIHCKRHYRNLASYSCCTTWREHFTKTAPAQRRHSVGGGGGGAPISYPHRLNIFAVRFWKHRQFISSISRKIARNIWWNISREKCHCEARGDSCQLKVANSANFSLVPQLELGVEKIEVSSRPFSKCIHKK